MLAWMAVQGAYLYTGLVWQALAGALDPPDALETHARQFLVLRWLQSVTWIATGVLFLAWLHRAQDAIRGPVHGSGRAILAAFLVPGPNLVRPVRLVSALWHAGSPPGTGSRRRVPWWVGCPWWVVSWWSLVLAAALAHALAVGLASDRSRPLDLGGPLQLLLLAEVLEIAGAVLAILLVRRITGRLDGRRDLST